MGPHQTGQRYIVYILTNDRQTVLYTGITCNLVRRVFDHRTHAVPGFTNHDNVDKLAFYREFDTPAAAIAEEQRIKGGSRRKKVALIDGMNPDWQDLYDELL